MQDEVDAVEGCLFEGGGQGLVVGAFEGGEGGREGRRKYGRGWLYFSDCYFGSGGFNVHSIVVVATAVAVEGHDGGW